MPPHQTHPAVVTVSPGAPLQIHQVPTPEPEGNEIKLVVQYTASTPLDLHQADSHLLVKPPLITGDGVAGTVIAVGPEAKRYKPGDHVFGFTWRNQKERGHQLYCVAPEELLGKVPEGKTMEEAVTLPNNFVTAWHTLTFEFGFELPWISGVGKPQGYRPAKSETETSSGRNKWILVWGGSSSCGMYTLQILRYYGYVNVIAIASQGHHRKLKEYGARVCFDYKGDKNVVERVKAFVKEDGGEIEYILDCIGSLEGSVRPCSRIAEAKGCKVAILLPVIVKDAAVGVRPEYEMDVTKCVEWKDGVVPTGVRTHFWMENKKLAEVLQTEIMPRTLETGVVEPNEQIIVEGSTVLERAEKALSMLREKKVSGGRLVWRIAEDDEVKEALKGIQK